MNSADEPLIDPALLASLTESERAEALAAAAAARRAEERAAKRAAAAEQSSHDEKLSPEDEEARALAQAMEEKRRARERERSFQAGSNDLAVKSIGNTAAADGLVFVSKKQRGQIDPTNSHAASTANNADHKREKRTNTSAASSSNEPHESHLTASQLASIKRAYLGDAALEFTSSSAANNNSGNPADMSDAISARRKLQAERAKRRVKKTTFKFEWGEEEDTFQEDDPLYLSSSQAFHKNNTASSTRSNNTTTSLGKRKLHQDETTSSSSVYTKPLSKMTPRDYRILRENYNILVKGGKCPPPLRSFRESSIHPLLLQAIETKLQYKEPSPIQRQAIPIGMERRDLIGIAETGSGKTAAFGIPLLHHILSFPPQILDTVAEEGPLALIMAPTRELALQIDVEIGKLLSRQHKVISLAVVGGQSITEQASKLRSGVHVVVGTPGRINDCVEMAYLVLNQCSYIVLDEADRYVVCVLFVYEFAMCILYL
jgi:ATP-dependent RNA helicase DDX23/PRP28